LDDECSKLIDQWKQAKLQWLQSSSQINADNLKIWDVNKKTRNKKRECLKDKINELEIDNKTKNIRDLYWDINKFR
jgi:hypothetical protein